MNEQKITKREAQAAIKALRKIKALESEKKSLTATVKAWIKQNPQESADGKHWTIDGASVTYTAETATRTLDQKKAIELLQANGLEVPYTTSKRADSLRV